MNIGMATVSTENRAAVIPQLKSFIAKMAKYTLKRRDGADIAADMLLPDRQLWVLYDKDDAAKLVGYMVTLIAINPQARHLVLVDCGGERGILELVFRDFFGTLEEFARMNECQGIEFLGRPGWKPFAKACGLRVAQFQYFKDLRGTP